MRAATAIAALALACGPRPAVVVGQITVDLVTPAAVDPLDGAEALLVRVLDAAGTELERALGTPQDGVVIPPIRSFGLVEIEITALSGGGVTAAARTGPIALQPGEERTIDALFLPVNTPVPLLWSAAAPRIGHAAHLDAQGRLLLIGGRPPGENPSTTTTEWWHPRLGFDGLGPALPAPQAPAATGLLADGSRIVVGGAGPSGATAAVTRIAADGGAIEALDPLDAPAVRACVAPHPTVGALVFTTGAVQVYGPDGRRGRAADTDSTSVTGCAVVGSSVLTVGQPSAWSVLELGDTAWPADLGASATAIPGQLAVDGPSVAAIDEQTGWVLGGSGPGNARITRFVDLAARTTDRGPDLQLGRIDGQIAAWRDGAFVLAGGFVDADRTDAQRGIELIHPERGTLLTVTTDSRNPTLAVLPGGALLLTGGVAAGGEPGGAIAIQPWLSR